MQSIYKDYIYKKIIVDEKNSFINELIETNEFQRLKEIKQLGLVSILNKKANHSRFEHSLGVYHLATKAVKVLKIRDLHIERTLLTAALLHDIGHGPFSHLLENVSHVPHEDISEIIIKSKKHAIYSILNKVDKKLVDSVCKLISKRHPLPWLNNLLSSEIDIDRLDYLLRDSKKVNMENISVEDAYLFLECLEIRNNQLVLDKKCLKVAKKIITTRNEMFLKVYSCPDTSIIQDMFERVMKNFQSIYINSDTRFQKEYKGVMKLISDKKFDLENYLSLTEKNIWNSILAISNKEETNIEVTNLSKFLLSKKKPKYEEFKKNSSIKKNQYKFLYILENKNNRLMQKDKIQYLDGNKLINVFDSQKSIDQKEKLYIVTL